MIVPSTTSHKHEPLPLVLEVFARLGMRDIDFNLWHCIESGVAADDVHRMVEAFDQRIRIVSGGWCDFFDAEPAFDATRRSVEQQVRLARELGVTTIRLFFGRLPRAGWSPAALGVVRDHLRRLSDEAPDLTFVMENHGSGAAGCPEVCRDILAAVDRGNVRMTFDPINAAHAGFDSLAAFEALRPFIGHVHLKGLNGDQYCEFGAGDVDLRPTWRALIASGYRGMYTVEYEGPADRTLRLFQGLRNATETWVGLLAEAKPRQA